MRKAFIQLHLAILLAGMTGVFGRLISLNEGLLVWYRLMFAAVFGILLFKVTHQLERMPVKEFMKIAGVGCLLTLHWLFFYASIKAANVSIGVVCFSLVGFFTALLEPLIIHRKFSMKEVLLGLLTVVGILLIFKFDNRYRLGIGLGIISSIAYVFFVVYNKKVGESHSPQSMITYEMIGGFAVLSCILPLYLHFFPVETIIPTTRDLVYLVIFATVFTILFQVLQLSAMKKISAFTVSISFNLEPVYSIIIAMILFNEAKELNAAFYFGLSLILLSVVLQTLRVVRENR